ncbi:hypothetical protein [Streptomyces sp. NPDC039016]|uniref:hypothetical protein n=1 Tax=Streptomyces sp. NPDC039016 TaxID=3154330 RepID=UPI0033BFE012
MADSTETIKQLVADGVRDQVYPGAVWAIGDAAGMKAVGTVGVLDPAQPDIPMRPDTVFEARDGSYLPEKSRSVLREGSPVASKYEFIDQIRLDTEE